MLYTAILVACLAGTSDCKTHTMLIQGNGIPYSVNLEAQTRAAAWLQKHPELEQKSLVIRAGREA
jgi:hypothetical protein